MAGQRKPAPLLKSGPSDGYGTAQPSASVDSSPETKRFALSDFPAPPGPRISGFDSLNRAVSQLQSRYGGVNAAENSPTGSLPVLPPHSEPSSLRNSLPPSTLDSGSYSNTTRSAGSAPGPGPPHDARWEPPTHVEYLPTIQSGEPLEWESLMPAITVGDPFSDASSSSVPLRDTMSSRQAAYGGRSSYPQSYYSQPPTRPPSSYAYASTVSIPLPSRPSSMAGLYDRPDSQTIPSSYDTYADHFRYDAEAYASGPNSQISYRRTRSRSPTPEDDEDEDCLPDATHVPRHTGERTSETLYDREKQTSDSHYLHPSTTQDGVYDSDDEKKSINPSPEPPTPLPTMHFGPAPSGRIHRRLKNKTKKRVQLTNGNLVVELDVPPKLILPRYGEHEMMKTRYTAVTCDADEFEKSGFFLRQNEYGRTTELFIVVTLYNEDEVLFCRTLYGIMQNVSHLCSRKNSKVWGRESWKKVVVCIVADGRKKVHPRVLDCLTLLGVYQPGDHMKNAVNNKAVTAHLFEYTTSFALDPNLRYVYPDKGIVPTQILFCMKEKNAKKINSHRWFFNAFAPMLQPNVCVLIDVGTRPGPKSIYHLWKTFDINSNVGGACGEIAAYKGKKWSSLFNPLVAAQNFEYKISNILDKPTESVFGYISVLPGAFSAYRYIALQNDRNGVGPLASYFKGEVLHGRETDIFTSNMYLAEDRILCFELIAKANSNWVLRYVKSAIGETDVPDRFPEFISQRRRWLNGSFFAATYAIAHVGQILRSGHTMGRKVMLMIETIYNIINLVFSWFAIGNFYLFFVILTSSLEAPDFHMKGIKYLNAIVQFLMTSLLVGCFLFSMGNKPRAAKWKYQLTGLIFAFLMCYVLFAGVMCMIQASRTGGAAYNTMLFSIIATYGVYVFASILAFDPWHMITSFGPYILLSPTYINILSIYAFCNLDDISWGTKQDELIDTDLGEVVQDKHHNVDVEVLAELADIQGVYEEALLNVRNRKPVEKPTGEPSIAEQEQAAKDYYASIRTNVLLLWVLTNGLLLVGILGGGEAAGTFSGTDVTITKAYMTFILAFVAITSSIRFIGSTLYLLARIFTG